MSLLPWRAAFWGGCRRRWTRKVSAGPVGVGSRYVQARTIPVPGEERFEVIEFEPDSRITLRGTFNSLPGEISYTLHPDADSTTVVNSVGLRPPLPLNLLAPIATGRIKSAVAANLDVLKQILERT
ncbi:MAG TPA: SRPBCC family protein [Pseudonocardiaceae bacterium]|nr:SRPBCC family protein [Pseudonocardiaceae bacterium]